MLITLLATAMTVVMLIATMFGLREEAERVRFDDRTDKFTRFGGH